ncbi:MAG: hypothetical protein RMI89_09515 [Gloeomargarita sp. SKYBB_i_bin120]|nr:hypothetical protein [Gloeomargarita sp. SKYB120]MDW8178754.1 hypothetical protein [Gloeomargarita sp. SKYBB_i_bin120]
MGVTVALAASHMGQRDFDRLRFESLKVFLTRTYTGVIFVFIGAGLGFASGAA